MNVKSLKYIKMLLEATDEKDFKIKYPDLWNEAEDPGTPSDRLAELVNMHIPVLTAKVASNPALPPYVINSILQLPNDSEQLNNMTQKQYAEVFNTFKNKSNDFFKQDHHEILQNLATNPNAHPSLLLALGAAGYQKELLKNPLLPLLTLDDPSIFSKNKDAAFKLASDPELPQDIGNLLFSSFNLKNHGDNDIHDALLSNPAFKLNNNHVNEFDSLLNDKDNYDKGLLSTILYHKDLEPLVKKNYDTIKQYIKDNGRYNEELQKNFAQHSATPLKDAFDVDTFNMSSSPEYLDKLIAKANQMSPEELQQLSKIKPKNFERLIDKSIVTHRGYPDSLHDHVNFLYKMKGLSDTSFNKQVNNKIKEYQDHAINSLASNTMQDDFKTLYYSQYKMPNAEQVLQKGLQSGDKDLIKHIKNHDLVKDALASLYTAPAKPEPIPAPDEDEPDSEYDMEQQFKWQKYKDKELESTSTSPELLHHYAGDDDHQTRLKIAVHPNTTIKTLNVLKTDKHPLVRDLASAAFDARMNKKQK